MHAIGKNLPGVLLLLVGAILIIFARRVNGLIVAYYFVYHQLPVRAFGVLLCLIGLLLCLRPTARRRHPARQMQSQMPAFPDFFGGCVNFEQVHDRYRKLMQIYHPDLETGDANCARLINQRYEALKAFYSR